MKSTKVESNPKQGDLASLKSFKSENVYKTDDALSSYTDDTLWDLEAGHEKWKKVRKGTVITYQPFEVEAEQEEKDEDDGLPPFDPDEPIDNTRNWPKSCPLLHFSYSDFKIGPKKDFISKCYYFWHWMYLVLLWNLFSATVTQLISPTPNTSAVGLAFVQCFLGFWWFFFAHFRIIYFAVRHRTDILYTIYAWHTILIFAYAIYSIFSNVGQLVQIISPLAPGSPLPVKQNPMYASAMLVLTMALWFMTMMACLWLVRKTYYFKHMTLNQEFLIYKKEQESPMDTVKTWGDIIQGWFAKKEDPPLDPVRCGMLCGADKRFGGDGKGVWVQGVLSFDTIYFDFQADLTIFDHLIKERFSYYDVVEIRKFQQTCLLITVATGPEEDDKRELLFDVAYKKVRTDLFAGARKLWGRIGRNSDILVRRAKGSYEDHVAMFYKARRMETKERFAEHFIAYKDWQKILNGVSMEILDQDQEVTVHRQGEASTFMTEAVCYVAQGSVRVVEISTTSDVIEREMMEAEEGINKRDEVQDWVTQTAREARMGRTYMNRDYSTHIGAQHSEAKPGPAPERGRRSSSEAGDDDSMSSVESQDMSGFEEKDDEAKQADQHHWDRGQQGGGAGVAVGVLQKEDVFGLVPFLLGWVHGSQDREHSSPLATLRFIANEPNTVVYAINSKFLQTQVLRSKKEVTAAWFKYLAIVLGERVTIAEDSLFNAKIREHMQSVTEAEAELAALRRQQADEAVFEAPAKTEATTVHNLFNFDVTEGLIFESPNSKLSFLVDKGEVATVRGTVYLTDHYLAFYGHRHGRSGLDVMKKFPFQIATALDEIVNMVKFKSKVIKYVDQFFEKKEVVLRSEKDRDDLYAALVRRWKEGAARGNNAASLRAALRRRLTFLPDKALRYVDNEVKLLARNALGEMTERDKKLLFAGAVPVGMCRNQLVIKEGQVANQLFLLQTGSVRIQRLNEHRFSQQGATAAANATVSQHGTGRTVDTVSFHEIQPGEMFGFDTFLTGAPTESSYLVDSDKAVLRSVPRSQVMAKLKEDKKLASKFYRTCSVSMALRLAEISPLDVFL